MVIVLRIGHRIDRDKRISSHLALVARALGAKKMIITGEQDLNLENSINKVSESWGGNFHLEIVPYDEWKTIIEKWKYTGRKIIHLTMYGENLSVFEKSKAFNELRKQSNNVAVVLGGEKIPGKVFRYSDWNIAITNQPHSEVGSLAIFLDHFFDNALETSFKNSKKQIIPSLEGKKIFKKVDTNAS
ncbi:MAG: tRNA (cytidine(56)-2'-O)-methyltransferase [Candidatus Hodarchaeota archaeon]